MAWPACGGESVSAGNGDPTKLDLEVAGAGATSCGGNITFDLAVEAPGRVYYEGSQPPWPAQDTCPTWLTLYQGSTALILQKSTCDESCPGSPPVDAKTQSLTWDGTYYPITPGDPVRTCATPACAQAGDYIATFCVAASPGDAGLESNPTCKTVPFTWPPAGGSQTLSVAIAPDLAGS